MVRRYLSITFALAIAFISSKFVQGEDAKKIDMAGGKIVAMQPEQWQKVEPKMNMIESEFQAPVDSEDPARITIMQASGSIDANIDRWVGQFDGAKRDDAKIEEKEIDSCKVHIVDLTGTFSQKMGGPFAPGPTKKIENYRMLAAIIETKDAGKIFIKMTGPGKVVESQVEAMNKMLASLKVVK